jgi:hypothetical protein
MSMCVAAFLKVFCFQSGASGTAVPAATPAEQPSAAAAGQHAEPDRAAAAAAGSVSSSSSAAAAASGQQVRASREQRCSVVRTCH